MFKTTIIATAIIFITSCVYAQTVEPCAPRMKIINKLEKDFHETPSEMGLSNNGYVVELTISPDGKTWTLMATRPSGKTCLMAAGEDWMSVPKKVQGTDS